MLKVCFLFPLFDSAKIGILRVLQSHWHSFLLDLSTGLVDFICMGTSVIFDLNIKHFHVMSYTCNQSRMIMRSVVSQSEWTFSHLKFIWYVKKIAGKLDNVPCVWLVLTLLQGHSSTNESRIL